MVLSAVQQEPCLITGRDGGRGACLGCPPSWDMCPQRNTPRPRRCAHPRQRCRSCLPPSAWTPTTCLMAEILPENLKSLSMSRSVCRWHACVTNTMVSDLVSFIVFALHTVHCFHKLDSCFCNQCRTYACQTLCMQAGLSVCYWP